MATLPVFHNEPMSSLRAIMLFPNDSKKAAACAAWMLVKGSEGQSAAVEVVGTEGILHPLALAATDHSFAEADQHAIAGNAVGEVAKALFALVNGDPANASWKHAISYVESCGERARYGPRAKGEPLVASSAATLRKYLKEFAPVLHLWGAWSIRERQWRHDASVGYSVPDDVKMFLCESEILLRELRKWDGSQHENSHSVYLQANAFQVADDWVPPPRLALWPRTGILPDISLDLTKMKKHPAMRKNGRPRANPV